MRVFTRVPKLPWSGLFSGAGSTEDRRDVPPGNSAGSGRAVAHAAPHVAVRLHPCLRAHHNDAEDILQNVSVAVTESIRQLRDESGFAVAQEITRRRILAPAPPAASSRSIPRWCGCLAEARRVEEEPPRTGRSPGLSRIAAAGQPPADRHAPDGSAAVPRPSPAASAAASGHLRTYQNASRPRSATVSEAASPWRPINERAPISTVCKPTSTAASSCGVRRLEAELKGRPELCAALAAVDPRGSGADRVGSCGSPPAPGSRPLPRGRPPPGFAVRRTGSPWARRWPP
jgi:hypothetical protein